MSLLVVTPGVNLEIFSDESIKSSIKYPCCLLTGEQLYKNIKADNVIKIQIVLLV